MSDPNAITAVEAPSLQPAGPRGRRGKSSDKPRSLAGDAWIDLRRNKIFWVSVVLVAVILLMAAWPTLFTSADPRACTLANQHGGATGTAYFGYDFQGCDVFAKTVYGARNSIIVGIMSTLLAGVIGLFFGLAAGYFGGWVDAVLSRGVDIMLGIPFLLGAIVLSNRLVTEKSDGVLAVTLTLGLLTWTSAARVMRSAVIASKNQDYVAAGRMLGATPYRLMARHILPNSIASFIVVLTILLGTNIASEATLSFLGVGLKNDAISWGISISEASPYARVATEPLVWPSIFLAATVLAFIMLGDAIRDAFDPKLR
ncbi:ABC-type dipeptide/oligopeptide/nickel transport system permease subunit [Actinoplanes lutulentus]|uniref:Peptide/nickel transport system permease protein/oligopeptide transport system permease protein n=1 Tax=Actinoplanes lutulentus TaxID=1287878 RepID=A0A327ZID7_9ACTN|nr:ABC transporter permease [Actinoplanes lutulentus]MBB2945481.1 ABC-type dipeptide/oligopeptide/nickel transport system permease subunit [Actinoplanes lutulentus]RAK40388.1 peptide/nickel transport system permease protein/oligopeptide transport system permease protein [Actinoplanes lutulentus]